MDKDTKNFLFTIGSIALFSWLLSRKHGKCPKCNYPITNSNKQCPNCGQWLDWEGFK